MKRVIFFLLIILFSASIVQAQISQFAVVRPDGTTYICPSFDSAYNRAVNGDNIYLPGGTYTCTTSFINKRLFIFGAGHHPDSSLTTGRTTLTNTVSEIRIDSGAVGGSLEGINLINNNLFFHYSNKRINGFTIKRCLMGNLYFTDGGVPTPPPDSLPTNVTVSECIFYSVNCNNATGNLIIKNLIKVSINSLSFCTIKNNIFFSTYVLGGNQVFSNCNIENNIFLSANVYYGQTGCDNNYNNNLKVGSTPFLAPCSPMGGGVESGTIFVASVNDIFVAFDQSQSNFPYVDNYHLKPTCPGVNAGTDGTDVGIYGTIGWVPSNPHIYFKQVAPQTNSNGQLPIQFKVRTNN
jgi:hypothetical protein